MNRLYYGDNLTVLRGRIDDESVDLVYLDPPFNSQATYNVLFKSTVGEKSKVRIPMMSISRSDLMPISAERSDAGLSQCETVIDIRQEVSLFSSADPVFWR